MLEKRLGDLEGWQSELINKAKSVMRNAYNPASKFYAGAAVLSKSGNVYLGTFAENSSQGMTICSEATAILSANTVGDRMIKAVAIIVAKEKEPVEEPVPPCGRCRQIIYDFSRISEYNVELICSNTRKDKVVLTSIEELLPLPFGPQHVGFDLIPFRSRP